MYFLTYFINSFTLSSIQFSTFNYSAITFYIVFTLVIFFSIFLFLSFIYLFILELSAFELKKKIPQADGIEKTYHQHFCRPDIMMFCHVNRKNYKLPQCLCQFIVCESVYCFNFFIAYERIKAVIIVSKEVLVNYRSKNLSYKLNSRKI